VTFLTTSKQTQMQSCKTRTMTTMTVGLVTAAAVFPTEVVTVEDAVSNDLVMAVEVANMEAILEEEVSTADEQMALMIGAFVVFVVLQDFVLIKGIWTEAYEMPAANALHVTNECMVTWLAMMIEMMLPLVVVTLTVDVMHPSTVRREHGPAEWQMVIKEVDTTNEVVHVEVVMVEDAVSSEGVMVVEEATTEATMDEDVSKPNEPMALISGTLGVFVVLQNLVLITGIWMEAYETPASNALQVTNECSMP